MLRDDRRARRPFHRHFRARNEFESPLRFQIDSRDQIRITNEIEARGEEIGAIFHSHPNSEARPRRPTSTWPAGGPGVLWVICSLAEDEPVIRAFAIDGAEVEEVELDCRAEANGAVEPLACPTCARKYPLSERFCSECEMPLVYVGRGEQEPITEAHERARKVKPQYTGGDPVKVAFAPNLAEAQLIQGMLLEEGIPSFERRTRGFDVPDFLAAGPRDILVPAAGAEAARELLADTAEHVLEPRRRRRERPGGCCVGILIARPDRGGDRLGGLGARLADHHQAERQVIRRARAVRDVHRDGLDVAGARRRRRSSRRRRSGCRGSRAWPPRCSDATLRAKSTT